MLLQRFGQAHLDKATPAMRQRLQSVGVDVDYQGQPAKISSTHLAHRLLTYVSLHSPSSQAALSDDLMLAHHGRGTSPSSIPLLTSAAVKHGVFPSEAAAKAFLESDEMDEEVNKGYDKARRMGISGVPFFVFDGQFGVSGAIGEEGFKEVFDQILPDDGATSQSRTNGAGGVIC